ncbi:arylsulfatase [Gloeothece verrucosa]|uniref:Sulfatase n=1 Tax=Gloeothece verrucosa (strain PCC 7822) TaxID=497965 RepID=E0UHU6_GLOV7|nr:arylsulfatase [Gloeothece verrucosa]ADN14476.1 sulfatase [Gloeothece verrucosa PCC 7822]
MNHFIKKVVTVVATIALAINFALVNVFPWSIGNIALAQTISPKKPNILVIMGDDVGWFNISAYNRGMMGYKTPNIDRIASEGMLFTDVYAEQSCTAGRAAFITGQSPGRTGMTKVGLPGVPIGLSGEDPTLAELLKPLGYATGQFGKNHLGDLDEFLPTVHGFDEFYGNLYHLNAEEEPENPDYPKNEIFKQKLGPRGVLHSYSLDYVTQENPEITCPEENLSKYEDENIPGLGQVICNTGPLTIERMKTVDDEFLDASLEFINKTQQEGKPFFVWFNTTRMHVFTHLKDDSYNPDLEKYDDIYGEGMEEHDQDVGILLDYLDEQGLTDDTIVIYTTDNGAEVFSWPDGGTTPFHGEKNTNWEGGFRVPAMIRWPGYIEAGQISNEIISHQDWLPTLLAAAGAPDDIAEQLKSEDGYNAGIKTFKKIHLDGYNLLPYLTDQEYHSPRRWFVYLTDDAYPSAIRVDDWKVIFSEQRAEGFEVWSEPYVNLRVPMILNLRRDPFEKAPEESNNYIDWRFRHTFVIAPAQIVAQEFLDTFREYPPRQKPASFSINQMLEDLLKDLEAGAGTTN